MVYETTGNPGVFDKTVTVHSNMRGGPVLLRITGSVERSVIPDLPEFSEAMGPLKFRKRYLSLGEVTHRQVITQEVEVYNPGKQPVRIAAGEVPGFLEVLPSPSLLQPGQKSRIHLVYDVSARKDWGYVADRVHLRINGAPAGVFLAADSGHFGGFQPAHVRRPSAGPQNGGPIGLSSGWGMCGQGEEAGFCGYS